MPISSKLLDIICCPVCGGELKEDNDKNGLLCGHCCLKYPIKDGIPILLPEEAQKTDENCSK